MQTQIPLLQSIRVASPCHADWESMESVEGERVKFCAGCSKNVYNLSAMSRGEAESLLVKHEGRLCVRYYQRNDGTILAGDCSVGAQAVQLSLMRRSLVAAGLFVALFASMAALNRQQVVEPTFTGSNYIAPDQRLLDEGIQIQNIPDIPAPAPQPVLPDNHWTMGAMAPDLHARMGKVQVSPSTPTELDVTDEAILKDKTR